MTPTSDFTSYWHKTLYKYPIDSCQWSVQKWSLTAYWRLQLLEKGFQHLFCAEYWIDFPVPWIHFVKTLTSAQLEKLWRLHIICMFLIYIEFWIDLDMSTSPSAPVAIDVFVEILRYRLEIWGKHELYR